MRPIAFAVILCLVASAAYARIPQPVIDNCNSSVDSYDEMPDCLKRGTVAFEMLGIALHETFYGPDAREIINGCWKRNGLYYRTWICFLNVAKKAVETRELIGLENITNNCYTMLSDFDKLEKLSTKFEQAKREIVGNRSIYWSEYSRPIKDCPEQDEQSQSHVQRREDIEKSSLLSEKACHALSEVDTILTSHSSSQIEATIVPLGEDSERISFDKWRELGLSDASYEYLRNFDKKEVGPILAALFKMRQPELWKMGVEKKRGRENSSKSANLGKELLERILKNALTVYEKECISKS